MRTPPHPLEPRPLRGVLPTLEVRGPKPPTPDSRPTKRIASIEGTWLTSPKTERETHVREVPVRRIQATCGKDGRAQSRKGRCKVQLSKSGGPRREGATRTRGEACTYTGQPPVFPSRSATNHQTRKQNQSKSPSTIAVGFQEPSWAGVIDCQDWAIELNKGMSRSKTKTKK